MLLSPGISAEANCPFVRCYKTPDYGTKLLRLARQFNGKVLLEAGPLLIFFHCPCSHSYFTKNFDCWKHDCNFGRFFRHALGYSRDGTESSISLFRLCIVQGTTWRPRPVGSIGVIQTGLCPDAPGLWVISIFAKNHFALGIAFNAMK